MCLCGSKKIKHIDTIDHIESHIEKFALSRQNSRDKLCLCGSKKVEKVSKNHHKKNKK
jgi:hypothetical protein